MSRGTVYEGKTFEEAVRRGLETLGLARAEAMITMIEEGKGGFLGFGARPYRVSVARRPGGPIREPEDRKGDRGGERRGGGRDRGRGGREGGREGGRDRDRAAQGRDRKGDERRDGGRRDERRERPAGTPVAAQGTTPPRERDRRPADDTRREGRGDERREGRRDERRDERGPRPRPAAAGPPPAVVPPPVPTGEPMHAEAEGDSADAQRKRRRRGRRGGRGRRRGGPEGAPVEHAVTNGASAMHDFEPEHETQDTPAVLRDEAPAPPAWSEPVPAPRPAAVEPAYTRPAAPPMAEPIAAHTASAPPSAAMHAPREAAAAASHEPSFTTDELAAQGRALTEDLLKAMGFDARVSVQAEGNRVDVTVEAQHDEDLLTGPKGETRQALQHLLNRFLNRGDSSRYHLQLEINDFWQRRERELEALARSLAEAALSTNSEQVTDYLNSQERRIVHVTLKEDTRVKTYALGTGMIKRVAVAPADFPERTGEDVAG